MSTAIPETGAPDWDGLAVTVVGVGVAGRAAAEVLIRLGADVTCVDDGDGEKQQAAAAELEAAGARVRLGDARTLPEPTALVVTGPGLPPRSPIFTAAAEAGVPVWGDVELAWRLRGPDAAPWLVVTGTNGKTTTVQMLEAILRADGKRTAAVGNIGTPPLEAVLTGEYDVLAVELSSFQIRWAPGVAPLAAACLNLAPDHLDWHGSYEQYAADKGKVYEGTEIACVYNVEDPATEKMVMDADVQEGCRAIGFTLGAPGPSMFGVVDGLLVDRAFCPDRHESAQELAEISDVHPPAPHNIANALAAAALARAYGVEPAAVREGLRAFRPDAHRVASAAVVDGVEYVDDSKATNPHAAAASLGAYEHVVWIAGGDAKGGDVDGLVAAAAGRLRAAVLIGRDRGLFAAALAAHAPDVPVVELDGTTPAVMGEAVAEARGLARAGDTVLLAPACASWDVFPNYGVRGDLFASAARALAGA